MTYNTAINLLMTAYHNEVNKSGRGCCKTNFRIALLMGAIALKACKQKDDRDKEQEAIYKDGTFVCPTCGASTYPLALHGGNYCQYCGQHVRWKGLIKQ